MILLERYGQRFLGDAFRGEDIEMGYITEPFSSGGLLYPSLERSSR